MYCGRWKSEDGKMRWPRLIGAVIGGMVMVVVFTAVFGFAVQYLWNWLMPALFNVAEITYYQAFGIMILARLLVGGFGGHKGHYGYRGHHKHHHKHGYDKSCNCDDYGDWQHYDTWWNEEGKDAFKKYADRQKKPE